MEGNPDDIQLIKQLDRTQTDAWEQLRSIAEEMEAEDHDVKWLNAKSLSEQISSLSYPAYSERVEKAISLLSTIGAVTPLYFWMEHGLPSYSPNNKLSPADAVRAATFVVRGERFSDGTIAKAYEKWLAKSDFKCIGHMV
ncbi:hypothetical protein J14TS2_31970 [Bacillus sp. J14TS2]|uniref:DUF6508 domain-containing protein n=1 Tax=Bacillus sp. J14TS2 TaxID=2807188 RepID=UPI001B0F426E|nr:DUF6508 domain-containing protein [Bacillus sp. J14TS2]GIN72722.1 hypothetical protein J14TS2_31970 [Bacillus sp. J14TS2]